MIDKVLEIIGWITIIIFFSIITLFIIMCFKLARYEECRDLDFEPKYCEKYKDF